MTAGVIYTFLSPSETHTMKFALVLLLKKKKPRMPSYIVWVGARDALQCKNSNLYLCCEIEAFTSKCSL